MADEEDAVVVGGAPTVDPVLLAAWNALPNDAALSPLRKAQVNRLIKSYTSLLEAVQYSHRATAAVFRKDGEAVKDYHSRYQNNLVDSYEFFYGFLTVLMASETGTKE